MTDSSKMGEWKEANSIPESENDVAESNQENNNQAQLQETSKDKSQEEPKDKPPTTKLQKKSITYCRRTKMSGGARLIEILIVILILQKITAGTDLFC